METTMFSVDAPSITRQTYLVQAKSYLEAKLRIFKKDESRADHLKEVMHLREKELLEAQLIHDPKSHQVSHMDAFLEWGLDPEVMKSMCLALIQHPVLVFFIDEGGYRGARYGIGGSEFISGLEEVYD